MGKNRTPLLQPMRTSSSTFYTFPSALEDIGLNINERNNKVTLSHYVTLNLPTLSNTEPDGTPGLHVDCAKHSAAYTAPYTDWIKDSLQNYVMNFETLLRNQNSYDYSSSSTVTERVFWKWLQKTGAVSFNNTIVTDDATFYTESWEDGENNIIKGFGSISTSSQQSNSYNINTETYIMIPSSYGQMKCMLKARTDNNYERGFEYTASKANYLEGFTDNSHKGFFDKLESTSGKYEVSVKDTLEFVFDNNDYMTAINQTLGSTDLELLSAPSYDDLAIQTSLRLGETYDFNTILVYYTIFDSAGNRIAINLFGVLFLNGIEESDEGAILPSYTKKSSSDGDFGSSYSFTINMKTASIYDSTNSTIVDYSTAESATLHDFNGAISNLYTAVEILKNNAAVMSNMYTDVQTIKELYANMNLKYIELQKNMSNLLTTMDAADVSVSSQAIYQKADSSANSLSYSEALSIVNSIGSGVEYFAPDSSAVIAIKPKVVNEFGKFEIAMNTNINGTEYLNVQALVTAMAVVLKNLANS